MNDFTEILRTFVAELGTRSVCVLSGVDRTSVLGSWLRDKVAPPDDAQSRLRFTYRVHRLLRSRLPASAVRAWFLGSNSRLNDEMPLAILAQSSPPEWDDVLMAAVETISL